MKIVVSGLGIIGASICASLKRAGYCVYGKNRSRAPIEYALAHQMIDGEASDYQGADVIFLALPPDITARELDCAQFETGCIVVDVCGVKCFLEELVYKKERVYRYIGAHPMAGKETSGITSASESLFDGANLILTVCNQSDTGALNAVRELANGMGFGKITVCSAKEHDEKIALTSQLAHIVSNAYVKSHTADGCQPFTGGSFQDMTRVAAVDENMWTQLYFYNRESLLSEMKGLLERLNEYYQALADEDEEKMRMLLREGRLQKGRFSLKD